MGAGPFGGMMQYFMMIAIFSGWGLPLGMPPSPPDPVVERAAPEECLFYVGWSGMAVADPKSKNRTERLLADPELREFIDKLRGQIVGLVRHNSKGTVQAEILSEELPDLLMTLLTHPTALYVAEAKPAENTVHVRGGLVVNAGTEAAAAVGALSKLEAALVGELRGAKLDEISISGIKLHRLAVDPQAPVVLWGFKDNLFLAALGEDEAKALVARVSSKGDNAPWLQEIRRSLPVARPAMTTYLNVELGLKSAAPLLSDPKAKAAIEAFGLAGVKNITSVTGLNETGATTKSRVMTAGAPAGVLSLLSSKALEPGDLSILPRDAATAYAARFDAAAAYVKIVKMTSALGGEEAQALPRAVAEFEKHFELRLVDDVLKPLGDVWTYSTATAGGMGIGNPFASMNLTVSVADREKLTKTHELVLKTLRADLQASGGRIDESSVGSTKVYSLKIATPLPVSPSWAITNHHLIVSLNMQDLTNLLQRDPTAESLASLPAVETMLKRGKGAPILLYQDSAAMVTQLYSSLQLTGPLIAQQLARQGAEFNIPPLPTLGKLLPDIAPTITLVRGTETGIVSEKYHSLPVTIDNTLMTPLTLLMVFRTMPVARQAARANQSTNNLHQIAIAMHNHHDMYKKFPPPAIYDKQDKPLLSWRVKLLPYLEEEQLYREFHLDEPWDSDHNKKLIARMPAVYADANDPKLVAAHKTRYLLPLGPAALFQDKKGVNMRQITDGTSKTLMMVEALPERAVIWTKPDDLEIDPKNPLAGLKGSPSGGFLAGFCDAAVRTIGDKTDDETMRRLFNPRDKLEVDMEKILAPAR